MDAQYTGHCLCGQLSITAAGEPVNVSLCHCRMCARHTGASFVHLAVYAMSDVQIKGETYGYESSPGVDRRGCKVCGAPSYIAVEKSAKVELYVGIMDEPKHFVPQYEIFTMNRPDWLPPLQDVPTYHEFRDDD